MRFLFLFPCRPVTLAALHAAQDPNEAKAGEQKCGAKDCYYKHIALDPVRQVDPVGQGKLVDLIVYIVVAGHPFLLCGCL